MKSKLLILLIPVSLLSFTGCRENVANPEKESNPNPNIVFIIADDMGWDVFGNYPGTTGTKAKTPTLDSLARSGITFNNFWTNPECAPTRAALLTGKYGFRTGVGGVEAKADIALKNTEVLIQKYVKDKTNNAYATAVIGKWHVSANTDYNAPENFGIDYYAGFYTGTVNDYYNWTKVSGGTTSKNTTYTTTEFVDESLNWVQKQTKPFFLWLAFNAPHTPFHRPPLNLLSDRSLSDNTTTINANPYPYYLASIEAMDREIGRLINSLTKVQRENTVFVFIGDNGTPLRVAQLPFTNSTSKSTLFQGGINCPMIISGKNVTRKNETENALTQSADLFATFAEIAGIQTPKYEDGMSMKPLFIDANASKRTYVYSELFSPSGTVNDGSALRNADYKYIKLTNGTEYFYKLSSDPFEKTNLLKTTLTPEGTQNLNGLKDIKKGL